MGASSAVLEGHPKVGFQSQPGFPISRGLTGPALWEGKQRSAMEHHSHGGWSSAPALNESQG